MHNAEMLPRPQAGRDLRGDYERELEKFIEQRRAEVLARMEERGVDTQICRHNHLAEDCNYCFMDGA